jgi:hypothetical protein
MDKVFEEVSILLDRVLKTALTAQWRERYASVEQWKEEGPNLKKVATTSWFAAKAIICENRFNLDKYVKDVVAVEPTINPEHVANYKAACLAIDKEVDYMFEQILLEADDEEETL